MIERISHSAIRDYLSCPALFYYRHILKLRLPEKPVDLAFGKAMHLALELYQKFAVDPILTFCSNFSKDDTDNIEKYLMLYEKGQDLLKEYLAQQELFKIAKIEIVKTEEKLVMTDVIDPKTGTKLLFKELVGVIDFETKDERIGDYKTASKPYTADDILDSMQPTIYYLLYYLEHGKLPESFIYIVFLKKRKRDPIQILETARTFEDISQFILLANDVYRKVENKEFEKTHDEHAWCDCKKYEELLRI